MSPLVLVLHLFSFWFLFSLLFTLYLFVCPRLSFYFLPGLVLPPLQSLSLRSLSFFVLFAFLFLFFASLFLVCVVSTAYLFSTCSRSLFYFCFRLLPLVFGLSLVHSVSQHLIPFSSFRLFSFSVLFPSCSCSLSTCYRSRSYFLSCFWSRSHSCSL